MDEAYLTTPLGIAKLCGDAEGLVSVSVLREGTPAEHCIPEPLEDACYQLREYFEGSRTDFDLKLNPGAPLFKKTYGKQLARYVLGQPYPIWNLPGTWAMF